jgi:hypothetical protein
VCKQLQSDLVTLGTCFDDQGLTGSILALNITNLFSRRRKIITSRWCIFWRGRHGASAEPRCSW